MNEKMVADEQTENRSTSKALCKSWKEAARACLTCPLCKGLFRDATTVDECMHTFCRICIEDALDDAEDAFCPKCNVDLGPNPLDRLRSDHRLADILTKIFPPRPTKGTKPADNAKSTDRLAEISNTATEANGTAKPRARTRSPQAKKASPEASMLPGQGSQKDKSEEHKPDEGALGTKEEESESEGKATKLQKENGKPEFQDGKVKAPKGSQKSQKGHAKGVAVPKPQEDKTVQEKGASADADKLSPPPASLDLNAPCEGEPETPLLPGKRQREAEPGNSLEVLAKRQKSNGELPIADLQNGETSRKRVWFTVEKDPEGAQDGLSPLPKRYLRTSSAMTFVSVQKYIATKLGLDEHQQVALAYMGAAVPLNWTLGEAQSYFLAPHPAPASESEATSHADRIAPYLLRLLYRRVAPPQMAQAA